MKIPSTAMVLFFVLTLLAVGCASTQLQEQVVIPVLNHEAIGSCHVELSREKTITKVEPVVAKDLIIKQLSVKSQMIQNPLIKELEHCTGNLDAQLLDDLIQTASKYGIDWRILLSIAFHESRYKLNAGKHKKCQGMFQINIVSHSRAKNGKAFDPRWAADYACRLLLSNGYRQHPAKAITQFGSGKQYAKTVLSTAEWFGPRELLNR